MKKLWNPEGIEEYAREHTIQECAEKYKCSYVAMQHHLLRNGIYHKPASKGVKGNAHYLYKHGGTKTRLFRIWTYMKRRCNNNKDKDYNDYGARGIKVCTDWSDFTNFKKWAEANGYSDSLTIDRIDNNKGYCPDNCRWVTTKEQSNNRRSNRLITYQGETKTVAQWAEKLGIDRHALLYRLNNWSVEEAFEKSLQRR